MSRRGENIYRRKDGRWEGRYIAERKASGRAVYKSVYASSYKEVKEKLKNAKIKRDTNRQDTNREPCGLTFYALSEQWLAAVRSTVKESSYVRYEGLIRRHILPELGNIRADALTAGVVTQFINNKLSQGRLDGHGGLSPKTVQDIAVVLKSILREASKTYAIQNGVTDIKLPKASVPELQVLQGKELQRLENALWGKSDNSSIGLLLDLYTGLRIGELCAVQWSDVDWSNGILHVHRTVLRLPRKDDGADTKTHLVVTRPKTPNAVRFVPIPEKLLAKVREIASGQAAEAYILTGEKDRFMDPRTYQYRFQRLLKELGIQTINFHAIRHTFATQCVRCGMDVRTLSEILGHANVEFTLNRYVHSSLNVKKQQIELLNFPVA